MIKQLDKLKNRVRNWHVQNLNSLTEEEYFELQRAREDLDVFYWFRRNLDTIFNNKIRRSKFHKHYEEKGS